MAQTSKTKENQISPWLEKFLKGSTHSNEIIIPVIEASNDEYLQSFGQRFEEDKTPITSDDAIKSEVQSPASNGSDSDDTNQMEEDPNDPEEDSFLDSISVDESSNFFNITKI